MVTLRQNWSLSAHFRPGAHQTVDIGENEKSNARNKWGNSHCLQMENYISSLHLLTQRNSIRFMLVNQGLTLKMAAGLEMPLLWLSHFQATMEAEMWFASHWHIQVTSLSWLWVLVLNFSFFFLPPHLLMFSLVCQTNISEILSPSGTVITIFFKLNI